jgi:hypothetical protein
MPVFTLVQPPDSFLPPPGKHKIQWFGWSREFMELLPLIREAHKKHGKPSFVKLKNYDQYNYTFHIRIEKIKGPLLRAFMPFAISLAHFRVGRGLNFFSNLINRRMTAPLFHFTIALMRAALVSYRNHEMAALYAPLTITNEENEFPLHCDLYIPNILWNVYEEVAPGDLGSSLFLPTEFLLQEELPQLQKIPAGKVKRIREILSRTGRKDRYEEFYDLLYNTAYPWTAGLKERLESNAYQYKFKKGEGYMLNDRLWMHGRTAAAGHVNKNRLHRLVFESRYA